jgi:hypothetical protein
VNVATPGAERSLQYFKLSEFYTKNIPVSRVSSEEHFLGSGAKKTRSVTLKEESKPTLDLKQRDGHLLQEDRNGEACSSPSKNYLFAAHLRTMVRRDMVQGEEETGYQTGRGNL